MAIFIDTLAKSLDFSGRASRKEWGVFFLFSLVVGLSLITLDVKLDWFDREWRMGPLTGIYLLLVFLPSTALMVRRLHDSNKSGGWLLILFIPYIGFIIHFGLMQVQGTVGPNDYGDDPLGREPVPASDDPAQERFVPKFNKDQ